MSAPRVDAAEEVGEVEEKEEEEAERRGGSEHWSHGGCLSLGSAVAGEVVPVLRWRGTKKRSEENRSMAFSMGLMWATDLKTGLKGYSSSDGEREKHK